VRSNCIAPFGFTGWSAPIPENDEVNRRRLAWARKMTPEKVAPLAVALMLDAAKDITGQIFSARMNELFLFSQSRPVRSAQSSDGWTPEAVAEKVFRRPPQLPAAGQVADVICWEPF